MKISLLFALTLFSGAVSAQEWTRFRGPDGSGSSAAGGFPDHFGEGDFAWKVALPGPGIASPVLWGSRLFLTSETAEAGKRVVLAFDAASGRELWRVEDRFSVYGQHQFNSFASSTPCVDGERLYLAWTSGGNLQVMALSHEGKALWTRDLGAYGEEHGSGSSPVLAGGVLVVPKDNVGGESFIAGLKPSDGTVVWKHARQSVRTPFSTPLVFRQADGREAVVLTGNPQALTCLDAADGRVLWEVENPSPTDRAVGSPTLAGGICFMTMGQGGTGKASVAVRVSEAKPSILWQRSKGLPYVPSALGDGKRIYLLGDGGVLTCLRAEDGTEVYSERVFADKVYSSPVMAGDRIYCTGRSGEVAVVAAGDTFRKLGEGQLGAASDATPAIAGGRLFFRSKTHLLCLPSASTPRP